jgi:hypothetical protein
MPFTAGIVRKHYQRLSRILGSLDAFQAAFCLRQFRMKAYPLGMGEGHRDQLASAITGCADETAGFDTRPEETALRAALERGAREAQPAEVAAADARLDDLLQQVSLDEPDGKPSEQTLQTLPNAGAPTALQGMRCARVVEAEPGRLRLSLRGYEQPVVAALGPGVELDVVQTAAKNGDFVVIDCVPGEVPWIMGALQSRVPRELKLRAQTIQIEAEQEVLLRSGRGALRLRSDGDVEIVGSRISAMSRGLFRLVGRVLRLN